MPMSKKTRATLNKQFGLDVVKLVTEEDYSKRDDAEAR
jgi:hypothetical protein